ncbi:hypothetical protein JD276_06645 [Leucobacter sp. CSA1]|uniref:HdeD family acid-resistance protein n=1 Tax=Leucobacter chromiisoli TaxID=2796471 RepID=A0A934UV01_9MICO|nr:hypothetical protein [Leucobacter chromiisoli]MBK0418713.1 hypothetical protein [Leucobacter chromiisoli]
MVSSESTAGRSTHPDSPRGAKLTRALLLLAAGLVIAFTATMHEQVGFDRAIVGISLGAIAAAHLHAWIVAGSGRRDAVTLLLALAALVSALMLTTLQTPIAFAVLVAAWALCSGVLEFLGTTLQLRDRRDSILMGATGLLLALLVILVREDQVAVVGFFGAYGIVAGVFLGISAFDGRAVRAEQRADEAIDPAAAPQS